MRYVFFAFAAAGMAVAWLNHTEDGARTKRHLFNPPVHASEP